MTLMTTRLTERDKLVLRAARRFDGPFSASALAYLIERKTKFVISTQHVFASMDRLETRKLLSVQIVMVSVEGANYPQTVWVLSSLGLNAVSRLNTSTGCE